MSNNKLNEIDESLSDSDVQTNDHIEGDNSVLDVDSLVTTEFYEMNDGDDIDNFNFDEDENFSLDEDMDDTTARNDSGKSINWFNIVLVGFVVIAIGAISYIYLPGIFSAEQTNQGAPSSSSIESAQSPETQNENTLVNQQPNEPSAPLGVNGGETSAVKENLVQQAIGLNNNTDNQSNSIDGLLNDPTQLDEIVNDNASQENEAKTAYETEIFDSLASIQNQGPMDTAVNDNTLTDLQMLPEPSDNDVSLSDFAVEEDQNLSMPEGNSLETMNNLADPAANFDNTGAANTLNNDITTQTPANPVPVGPDNMSDLLDLSDISLQNDPAENVPDDMTVVLEETMDRMPLSESNADQTSNQEIEALSSRIDTIAARLDRVLELVEQNQSANSSVTNINNNKSDNGDIKRLENLVSSLNRKIQSLEQKPKTTNRNRTQTSQQTRQQPSAPINSVVKQKPRSVTMPEETNSYNTALPSATNWELRGASPGQAFIAEAGSPIIRTIRVGDKVKSVGRVVSIAVENNRWVVRGTQSMITQ